MSVIRRAAVAALLSVAVLGLPGVSTAGPTAVADPHAALRVHRTADGRADFIGTAPGRAVAARPGSASPAAAARDHVTREAARMGIAAPGRDLALASTRRSATGGSIVRFQQEIAGLPVLGGDVVVTQDADRAMTSVLARVSSDRTVLPQAEVPVVAARRTAVAATGKAHDLAPSDLVAADRGVWAYDPVLLHQASLGEARRVHRFDVSNGTDVNDLVLVDATSGRLVLRVDQVQEALDRVVCDNDDVVRTSQAPCTAGFARTESGAPSPIPDVNSAFDLSGATAAMYAEIGGLDLTELIGTGTAGSRKLASTVRWCESVADCPMDNAFWNGQQIFYGAGYAGADDVVAHELTHGVIDRFSQLFYFHQSGAINESMADVMGEIVDHRHLGGAEDDAWELGEDLPGGVLRDMADPTAYGQPDRMTSELYRADQTYQDNGGVHTNSGVGNKTAYLISQGGTFNGVTVAGIDAGDPTLTKTATLYLEVIKRLVSGSEYADLARVLQQSCADLSTARTAGLTASDCGSVAAAVQATELAQSPIAAGTEQPAEAPEGCPIGTTKRRLTPGAGASVTPTTSPLWFPAPHAASPGIPANDRDGAGSSFGFNPDPKEWNDPYSSTMTLGSTVLPAGQQSYLRFEQWRLFEWVPGSTPTYYDGGLVGVSAANESGGYVGQPLDPAWWDNGPQQDLVLTNPDAPVRGFGGDSNGWVSSRVDLTSLAGRTIRPGFTVAGDYEGSMIGWFLDGIEVYTCDPPPVPPAAPTQVLVQPQSQRLGVILGWSPPTDPGSGTTGYRVSRSDGRIVDVPLGQPDGQHTLVQGDLTPGRTYTFTIRALGVQGLVGSPVSRTLRAVRATIAAPTARVKAGTTVVFRGTVTRVDTGAAVGRRMVHLQYRTPGTTTWRTLTRPDGGAYAMYSRADGTYRFAPTVRRTRDYRVLVPGSGAWFFTRSGQLRVRVG